MGDHREWSPNGAAVVTTSLGDTNWSAIGAGCWEAAERVADDIISYVRPTEVSDSRRREVVEFVQNVILSAVGCEVYPFGSVPLRTYLPDGDIDLTSVGAPKAEDALAGNVLAVLQDVEHSMNTSHAIKDVQLIRAEVKIVKCLVQNIVVDISFNQLGGLSTLCFLEQVDRLTGKDHLFKRSIILIKAWCYYESRILGAHHGLISTYALETLVLYIFHVFHSSLTGPLAVLYKFLDYFSKFDWDNYCVSLSGPICMSSFPEVTVVAPENSEDLLLSSDFLRDCVNTYSFPSGTPEIINHSFQKKHLNIVDPLKSSNNLGRSVSRGNFFRIRSAFSYGARKLGLILSGNTEGLVGEVQNFFTSTLDRHGQRQRPDVQDAFPLHSCTRYSSTIGCSGVDMPKGEWTTPDSSDFDMVVTENSRQVNASQKISMMSEPMLDKSPHVYSPLSRNENKNKIDEGQSPRFGNSDSPKQSDISDKDSNNEVYTNIFETRPSEASDRMPNGCEEHPKAFHLPCRELTSNTSNDALVLTDSLADLSGDYESNLRNLQRGRWFYEHSLSLSVQPMQPVFAPHMAFRPSIFPHVSPGTNGVRQSPFYLVNQQMMNGSGFHIEEKPKMRGIGTYFPNVNHYADSRPISRARNFVPLRSPRDNGNHVFASDMNFQERASNGFLPPPPYMQPSELMHVSENFLCESPRRNAFPDFNDSANIYEASMPDLSSFDQQLLLDSPAAEGSAHQGPDTPSTTSSVPSSGTQNPWPLAPGNQERAASKSFRLKDSDDFPPLSS